MHTQVGASIPLPATPIVQRGGVGQGREQGSGGSVGGSKSAVCSVCNVVWFVMCGVCSVVWQREGGRVGGGVKREWGGREGGREGAK